jgi:short-subunit dehydrogenase
MSKKKVVLITGATSGIGRSLARCFAGAGYDLIITARHKDALKITAAELEKQYKVTVTSIVSDLSKPNAAAELYELIKSQPVDVLVNNAGNATYGLFAETDNQALVDLIRLNVESLTHLTRLILPGMVDLRSGRILNVASTAAFQPGPLMAVYSATKAYVLSFSEALRFELKGTGISVTTLCPGATDTSFQKRASFSESNLVKFGMMSADKVAEEGFRGLMDNRELVIPGFKNKLGTILSRFSPRPVVLRAMNKLNTTRK